MKRIVMCVALLVCVGFSSCKKDDTLDFNAQLAKDVSTIDAYLLAHNITAVKDPSGLRYTVEVVGTGLKPTVDSRISVKYDGYFLGNATAFQSSAGIGLIVNQLIKGWQIAVPLMTKGSKFTLYLPSGLAYGPSGDGNGIPPNANIKFEIELIDDDAQLAADLVILDQYLDGLVNAGMENLVYDPRGFRYHITTVGQGNEPIATSNINVTFVGKFLDGSTFATQSNSVTAPMNQLLLGWQYALPSIPAGSQFTLYLPSVLAYGPGGYDPGSTGVAVPPNTNVIFDINLISIN